MKMDTSGIVRGHNLQSRPEQKFSSKTRTAPAKAGKPQVGETIIFPFSIARGHNSPFGVGKILEVTDGRNFINGWATTGTTMAEFFSTDGGTKAGITRTVEEYRGMTGLGQEK